MSPHSESIKKIFWKTRILVLQMRERVSLLTLFQAVSRNFFTNMHKKASLEQKEQNENSNVPTGPAGSVLLLWSLETMSNF